MFCALMKKKKRKCKIELPKTLEDCKKIFDEDSQWRYAVVSCKDEKPIYICQTYESAKKSIEDCWKYGNPISKIVDLMYWDMWKTVYDKEPICKE